MLRQPGGGLGVRAKALADAHGFTLRIWCDSVGAAPRTRSTLRMNPGACARSSVNMVNAGSEAKRAIAAGSVRVNDVELRRGRQLHSGDVVAVGNERARVP